MSWNRWSLISLAFFVSVGAAACGSDDPEERPFPDAGGDAGGDTGGDTGTDTDPSDTTGLPGCEVSCQFALDSCELDLPCDTAELVAPCIAACEDGGAAFRGALASEMECDAFVDVVLSRLDEASLCYAGVCEPAPTDYGQPDAWPACVSDGGNYVQIEENVSTIARIGAFERMASLLWLNPNPPSPDDFLAARDEYSIDEGLGSRVARREDEHLPPVRDGNGAVLSCRDEGVPALDPARCVGPAQMVPLINEAFQAGVRGETPRIQAARIEATLLWFLYLSVHKEAITCSVQRRDCDSAWAYYGGGEQRDGGLGLAAYFRTITAWSHDRTFDGLLAMRCWRDIDNAPEATNMERMNLAIDQLDTGLLHGMARTLADRALRYPLETGEVQAATWEFVKILGGALVRGTTERSAALGAELSGLLGAPGSNAAVARISEIVLETFGCP